MYSATAAVKHAAALLGCTTHAANNHQVSMVDESGGTVTKLLRDATPAPQGKKRQEASCTGKSQKVAPAGVAAQPSVQAWAEKAPSTKRRHRDSLGHAASIAEAANVRRRVDEIGASLSTSTDRPTASQRMQLLAERVRLSSLLQQAIVRLPRAQPA